MIWLSALATPRLAVAARDPPPFLFWGKAQRRQPFSTTTNTTTLDDACQVLSSLQLLVQRLESPGGRHSAATNHSLLPHHLCNKQLVERFCTGYQCLPPLRLGDVVAADQEHKPRNKCPRGQVLDFLALQCGPPGLFFEETRTTTSTTTNTNNSQVIEQLLLDQRNHPEGLERIKYLCTPRWEAIFQQCLEHQSRDALVLLVTLREDVLRFTAAVNVQQHRHSSDNNKNGSTNPYPIVSLQQLEQHLKRLLMAWISPGMLEVRRITFDTTSADIIEKIALKEAVHPMKSLDDLRRRLGPRRRVFALFHPLLPGEPLVILHVHLEHSNQVPAAMEHVLAEEQEEGDAQSSIHTTNPSDPVVATFYSISNTQFGLSRGMGLGEHLIKQAVTLLRQEFPASLKTFVTLSPIPSFRKWLERRLQEPSSEVYQMLAKADPLLPELIVMPTAKGQSRKDDDKKLQEHLGNAKPILEKLVAQYLVNEKNPKSKKPLDPVTGFHVGNGAEVYRINVAADLSRKGMQRSFGIMVNYRYRLEDMARYKARWESSQYAQVPVSELVKELLSR